MKSTIISMFIVLIVLIVAPMFLFGEGKLAQKFGFGGAGGSVTDSIEALKDKAPKNMQQVVTDKKVEVYKWVDEHGVMQFSSIPPEVGASEKLVLSPDTNVMDAIKLPEKAPEPVAAPQVFNLGSPYSADGMKQLVDDTQGLQELLNQRQAEQEKIMQGMFGKK